MDQMLYRKNLGTSHNKNSKQNRLTHFIRQDTTANFRFVNFLVMHPRQSFDLEWQKVGHQTGRRIASFTLKFLLHLDRIIMSCHVTPEQTRQ